MIKFVCLLFLGALSGFFASAQPWVPDLKDKFKNPVLFADYSDPDVIRVGDDFYMVASSFNCTPGIPVLHSRDLVNWKIINHVYKRLPYERYNKPVHGQGSWAPSIRYHNNTFYVYFCTPHDGLFMAQTDNPLHEWELHTVAEVEEWEDPCPLWDDDGNAYLVRSKVCGNELFLHKLSPDGKKLLDNGKPIYKDASQPTIEGPKFLKKDGYYYILAPAGGVPQGWQTVLRSKNIYGPYESKNVLHQGNTDINGPHQGGIVELKSGEWWFMHFQSRGLYGRIVHLQPARWENGWPMIGVDVNGDGIGEPVMEYKKPNVGKIYPTEIPQTSDEFNSSALGLQWQWHANPKTEWYTFPGSGILRLNMVQNLSQNGNLWFVPNLLLQKFPAPSFTATAKVDFKPELVGDKLGLAVMGNKWAYLSLTKTETGIAVGMSDGAYNQCGDLTQEIESTQAAQTAVYLRVFVNTYGVCSFSYSEDNKNYRTIGKEFKAEEGRWIGAKVGLFAVNPNMLGSNGYADVDWFKME